MHEALRELLSVLSGLCVPLRLRTPIQTPSTGSTPAQQVRIRSVTISRTQRVEGVESAPRVLDRGGGVGMYLRCATPEEKGTVLVDRPSPVPPREGARGDVEWILG